MTQVARAGTAAMPAPPAVVDDAAGRGVVLDGLSVWFGSFQAVDRVSLRAPENRVTALIGPSGCGKSTVLRAINRMHDFVPGARVEGGVTFNDIDVYAPGLDPGAVRSTIGMVFQRPNPFPTKSIYDNVVIGVRLRSGRLRRAETDVIVERALRDAQLWDEVKDRLHTPATRLSGGQQQRLCIARAIAVEPELLLMDEPCAALDPIATFGIEELIRQIVHRYTVVMVTHNMQQAGRVSDYTAFMTVEAAGEPGRLVEMGPTEQVFARPAEAATEAYITGRVG